MSDVEKKSSPIYFMVAVWGSEYLEFMCRYLLRSMLTPGNLLLLNASDGHRFLIATTASDRERLQAAPEVIEASRHVQFEWVEIPDKPSNVSVYRHMTFAHSKLVVVAGERRAYGCMLAPDVYLSENFVSVLLRHMKRGTDVLLISGWHTAQKVFFAELRRQNLLMPRAEDSQASQPELRETIVPGMSAEQLGKLCSVTMHSCVASMEWTSACFDDSATFVWWRLPGSPGLLLHCMFWVEMGLDYSKVKQHSASALDTSTIEALYVQENFGSDAEIQIINDGSEAFVASWKEDDLIAENLPRVSPEKYLRPKVLQTIPLLGFFIKGVKLRSSLRRATSEKADKIKMRLFFQPVVWGRCGFTPDAAKLERQAQRVLSLFVGDFRVQDDRRKAWMYGPWFFLLDVGVLYLRFYRAMQRSYIPLIVSYCRVIRAAIEGDRIAQQRICRRFGLTGRE